MKPSISDYIDALTTPVRRFRTLGEVVPLSDARGEVRFYAGNSAAVFPVTGGKILKCYIKQPRHTRQIYGYVASADDPLLAPCRLLEREIFVHDFLGGGDFHDLVAGELVDGITLETALRRASREGGFVELSAEFDRLSLELLAREWAHGDLKPDNIMVRGDETMCLVDYDAMWVPTLEGETTAEVGTPQYQHVMRDENFYCKAIDDFPIAFISVSLRALALDPSLYARHNRGDNIILYPEGEAVLDEVMGLFSEHGQWHSLRLAEALRTPVPNIDNLREMLSASAADVVSALPFCDGVAAICPLGVWKIVDERGVVVAVLDGYDEVKPFREGVAAARRSGRWGYIRTDGTAIVEPRFEMAGSMREGRAVVRVDGKFGFVDAAGAIVIPAEWDYAMSFRVGRATVSRNNEDFEIDRDGKVV